MRVLVVAGACGDLTAREVGEALRQGWLEGNPSAEVDLAVGSDGSGGLLDAIEAVQGGVREVVTVTSAAGPAVPALILLSSGTAYIQAGDAVGVRADATMESVTSGSSAGVGQLILAARDAGARTVIIETAPAAVLDAGWGAIAALAGLRPEPFDPTVLSDDAAEIVRAARANLAGLSLVVVTSELAPCRGLKGPASALRHQFGPEESQALETRLAPLISALDAVGAPRQDLLAGPSALLSSILGSGSGGGRGLGVLVLGGAIAPGATWAGPATGLARRAELADLVVVGSEQLDPVEASSGLTAVAAVAAREAGVAVLALSPTVLLERRGLAAAGISSASRVEPGTEGLVAGAARAARGWAW